MNLPKVVSNFVAAQNNYDSAAFTACFATDAVVFDEGKTHQGKAEVKAWIEKANATFKTVMEPKEYDAENQQLKAEISGNFPGSPLVLTYHFQIRNDEIHSLRIV